MPVPVPTPAPLPPPSGDPLRPDVVRTAPHWLARDQQWARGQVLDSHMEALYLTGEHTMLVLMWRAADHRRGLVERCPTCYLADRRLAEAFGQATRADCPDCFGTTFEGGYRARIIRPALWTDTSPDTTDTPRGEVTSDTMAVETSADFTLHRGDYLFRVDGRRYRAAELGGAWVRTGFAAPGDLTSVGGHIPQARLEDDVASVAYLIPPDAAGLAAVLYRPPGQHLAPDLSAYEDVRGPLLVA